MTRLGELARLKDRIQSAIDNYDEWGQFEVWWQNPVRTQTVCVGDLRQTFHHDDDLLRWLITNFHAHRYAWEYILICFKKDRETERWKRDDWTPSDERGPHHA